jgi:hypothetical protein
VQQVEEGFGGLREAVWGRVRLAVVLWPGVVRLLGFGLCLEACGCCAAGIAEAAPGFVLWVLWQSSEGVPLGSALSGRREGAQGGL